MNPRRLVLVTCLLVLAASKLSLASTAPATEPDATAIVEAADRVRFPADGFQVDIAITTKSTDESPELRKYRVLSKGNDNTIVLTVSPEADHGQMLLMKGNDLWWFSPTVSQPVRLSVAQRLTGEVAYGDLARANFAGDYTPKLLRTDTLDGNDYYVLELTAVSRSVTYAKVLYWVAKGNNYPFKAEFYSLSGRLLKSCRYEEIRSMGGKLRPTRLVMEDALRKGTVSVMEYDAMKPRDLPDYVFTKEYLKKLD